MTPKSQTRSEKKYKDWEVVCLAAAMFWFGFAAGAAFFWPSQVEIRQLQYFDCREYFDSAHSCNFCEMWFDDLHLKTSP